MCIIHMTAGTGQLQFACQMIAMLVILDGVTNQKRSGRSGCTKPRRIMPFGFGKRLAEGALKKELMQTRRRYGLTPPQRIV